MRTLIPFYKGYRWLHKTCTRAFCAKFGISSIFVRPVPGSVIPITEIIRLKIQTFDYVMIMQRVNKSSAADLYKQHNVLAGSEWKQLHQKSSGLGFFNPFSYIHCFPCEQWKPVRGSQNSCCCRLMHHNGSFLGMQFGSFLPSVKYMTEIVALCISHSSSIVYRPHLVGLVSCMYVEKKHFLKSESVSLLRVCKTSFSQDRILEGIKGFCSAAKRPGRLE